MVTVELEDVRQSYSKGSAFTKLKPLSRHFGPSENTTPQEPHLRRRNISLCGIVPTAKWWKAEDVLYKEGEERQKWWKAEDVLYKEGAEGQWDIISHICSIRAPPLPSLPGLWLLLQGIIRYPFQTYCLLHGSSVWLSS
jgi:hypothetical protein